MIKLNPQMGVQGIGSPGLRAGSNRLASNPIMAITTNNSIKVKAMRAQTRSPDRVLRFLGQPCVVMGASAFACDPLGFYVFGFTQLA